MLKTNRIAVTGLLVLMLSLLAVTETELLGPLDDLAVREVEAAARQVAAVTALVPLALADVVAALTAGLASRHRIFFRVSSFIAAAVTQSLLCCGPRATAARAGSDRARRAR